MAQRRKRPRALRRAQVMADLLTQIAGFVQNLAAGPLKQPKAVTIPPANCLPAGSSGADVNRDKCYLTLTVNELFLSEARKWWAQYQPMVVFATSFLQAAPRLRCPRWSARASSRARTAPRPASRQYRSRRPDPFPRRQPDDQCIAVSRTAYQSCERPFEGCRRRIEGHRARRRPWYAHQDPAVP